MSETAPTDHQPTLGRLQGCRHSHRRPHPSKKIPQPVGGERPVQAILCLAAFASVVLVAVAVAVVAAGGMRDAAAVGVASTESLAASSGGVAACAATKPAPKVRK
jgi:hypothetical protein